MKQLFFREIPSYSMLADIVGIVHYELHHLNKQHQNFNTTSFITSRNKCKENKQDVLIECLWNQKGLKFVITQWCVVDMVNIVNVDLCKYRFMVNIDF